MVYRKFSRRQLIAMSWWNRPALKDYDGILCDGAVRSGKTLCMTVGFFLWSMSRFDRQVFGICGKSIGALRRNMIDHLSDWLGNGFSIREHRSENKLVVSWCGRKNTYYLFGGADEGAASAIQGITLAGVLLDEAAVLAAVQAVKKECGYLFESNLLPPGFASGTGAAAPMPRGPGSLAEALRERFERR